MADGWRAGCPCHKHWYANGGSLSLAGELVRGLEPDWRCVELLVVAESAHNAVPASAYVILGVIALVMAGWAYMLWTRKGRGIWFDMPARVYGSRRLSQYLNRACLVESVFFLSLVLVVAGSTLANTHRGPVRGIGLVLASVAAVSCLFTVALTVIIMVTGRPRGLVPPSFRTK